MTATLTPPGERATPTPAPPRQPSGPPARARRAAVAVSPTAVAAEVALAVLTLVTAAGFVRMFGKPEGDLLVTDWSFLPEFATAAAVSHVVAIGCRRVRLHAVVATVVSVACLVVVGSLLLYRGTTTWGMPTGVTWDLLVADLRDAWHQFGEVKAPAPVLPGFMAAGVVALWLAAFLADSFAFRLRAAFEAMLPAGTVFVFCSMLSAPGYRLVATAGWLAAALAFCALHRAERLERLPGRLLTRRRHGPAAVLRSAWLVGAAAVGALVVLGPSLPGAYDLPVFDWKHGSRSTRQVLSPLVDIRARLVNQSDQEAFTVTSDTPSYWRLTSLDRFTGSVWESSLDPEASEGALAAPDPSAAPSDAVSGPITQTFTITGLRSPFLPAAYVPVRIDGAAAQYDPGSGSLLTGADDNAELTYTVTSRQVRPERTGLRRARAIGDAAFMALNTQLPADFPDQWVAMAEGITLGARTDYDRALRLQDWFRSQFTYSLDVDVEGHSTDAIADFIAARQGYCEQFAGTFAVFARAIGLPARVAVGFTAGQRDADGTYRVRGEHAHAWAEVYFRGYGWVYFEPTPSRGAPNAAAWTGVEPAQATPDDAPEQAVASTTTVAPGATGPAPDGGAIDPAAAGGIVVDGGAGPGGSSSGADRDSKGFGGLGSVRGPLKALALAGVAWLVAVPGARRAIAARRRRAATTTGAQVIVAWREAVDALALAGVAASAAETPGEFAERAGGVVAATSVPLRRLAADATSAAYAGVEPHAGVAERARADSVAVARVARDHTGRLARLARLLDPRTIVRPGPDRKAVREVDHRPHA